jgi:hypothetical protein
MARKFILYISKDKYGNPFEYQSPIIAESSSEAIEKYGGRTFVDGNGWTHSVMYVRDEPCSSDEEKRYYEEKRNEQKRREEEQKRRNAIEKRREEERIRLKNEQNKRDYDRALSDINEAESKINAAQTSADFVRLIEMFSQTVKILQTLSGSFEVRGPIEKCEVYRKQCEEKKNPLLKEEALSRFSAAKTRIQNMRTAEQYGDLTREFSNIGKDFKSLPGSFGVQVQIEECEKYRKQFEEKWKTKQRRKEIRGAIQIKMPGVVLSFLYFAVIGGLIIALSFFKPSVEVTRIVIVVIFGIFGIIVGFMFFNETSGCLAVLLGVPLGALLGGGLVGYLIVGGIFSLFGEGVWIFLSMIVLFLSILLYQKVIRDIVF